MNYDGDCFRLVAQRDLDGEVEGWELTARGADGLFRWADFFVMDADRAQFLEWARQRGARVNGDVL